MLGLRPRPQLRARSSLIDLIAQSRIERSRPSTPQAVSTTNPFLTELVEEAAAIPLPEISVEHQYTKSSDKLSEAADIEVLPAKLNKVKMAPKKEDNDDEQLGSVFSVSGPVITAENMLGCAMYELVSCHH